MSTHPIQGAPEETCLSPLRPSVRALQASGCCVRRLGGVWATADHPMQPAQCPTFAGDAHHPQSGADATLISR
jgi:hypothetical protein